MRALALYLLATLLMVPTAAADLRLWYDRPAGPWEEALPVGNGHMGAMVFGGVAEERIQYNQDTLWTGRPRDYVRAGAGEHLAEIRRLIFEGQHDEAAALVRAKFLSDPVRQKAYQPFGDLRFTFTAHAEAADYRRELDLDSAIASVSYRVGGVTHRREVLASYPDNAILMRIWADRPGQVDFTVRMTSPHRTATTRPVDGTTLAMRGQVLDPTAGDEPGLKFESRLRLVQVEGGSVATGGASLTVRKADAATLALVAATSYVNFQDISADPAQRCQERLERLQGRSYEQMRQAHVADHQRLFRRVTLDLGRSDRADLPTDRRLDLTRAAVSGAATRPVMGIDTDPSLISLYFQMGRYMLIASSRPGSQPANLQGVWNELLSPPWESKYTTNINFEMNYWPAELTGLGECHEPLFDMVDDLRISGARTAQKMYNARGWVLHHNTDHWRGTAPINNIDGMWPTGGAWLCWHLWERYRFTLDREFLARRAYPAMREASLFFVDSLVAHPRHGWLVTNPSHSPEQGPLSAGPAMDMQLIRALWDSTIEAAGILGIDADLVAVLKEKRARLAPDQIGRHGQLQEWLEDVDQPNNNHRHMSPLWGLYPGDQFTPDAPRLLDAAHVLLRWRGDGSTGWSYAWRMPLWARVHDGDFAHRQLCLQLARRTFPNLFDKCGPFQVDGNFGATAGIVEMLLQSHRRTPEGATVIELLPALPRAWPAGSVTGLHARGGFEVDIAWKDGALTKSVIRSKLGRPCQVRWGEHSKDLQTVAGQEYVINGQER